MEKPNPELYNSEGHYEADLEKYNEMKNMSAEDIKLGILIDKGNGKLFSLSEQEIIFAAMEEYAAQFQTQPSQSKPVLSGDLIEKIVELSCEEILKHEENKLLQTEAALRKQVWDCSDIAVKFNNWVRDESYIWDDKIKKYVAVWNNYAEYTTSALFSYWFNEIYNKK